MKNSFNPLHQFSPGENTLDQNKELIEWYLSNDFESYRSFVNQYPSTHWMKKGEERALEVFHLASKKVPAYKHFLEKNSVDPQKILTTEDFKNEVPVIDKKNYITQYGLDEMSWDGKLLSNSMTSFSSGTSGTQCYWPRSTFQDIEGAFMFEQFLCSVFQMHKKKTLFVLCFALGNYVAGTYVLSCLNYMSMKGYPFMVVSPGISQEDALRMITKLSPDFEQTILCGYPPLLRDLIHTGKKAKLNWEKLSLRFLFSSELFSEVWRERVLIEAGTDLELRNSTNLYGTADATLFGMEHPIDMLVRKEAFRDLGYHMELFGSELTPTFVQYNPMLRYFELVGEELVLTSFSGLPLVRYNLHDQGGILSQELLISKSSEQGLDLQHELKKNDCLDTVYNLPHVFIFGRTDGTVSFYGLLIHPEYIKTGLEDNEIQHLVTGKFTMSVEQDKHLSPKLIISIELAPEITLNEEIEKIILKRMMKKVRLRSAEYNRLVEALGKKAHPVLKISEYGKDSTFQISIKQRWIKRT